MLTYLALFGLAGWRLRRINPDTDHTEAAVSLPRDTR